MVVVGVVAVVVVWSLVKSKKNSDFSLPFILKSHRIWVFPIHPKIRWLHLPEHSC